MSREGLVRVIWLTTWRDAATHEFAPAVGLDAFPHIDSVGSDFCGHIDWWKNVGLREFMAHKDEAFVWTDDDIGTLIRKGVRHDFEGRCLVITPMSSPGLEPHHLERIETFLLDNTA